MGVHESIETHVYSIPRGIKSGIALHERDLGVQTLGEPVQLLLQVHADILGLLHGAICGEFQQLFHPACLTLLTFVEFPHLRGLDVVHALNEVVHSGGQITPVRCLHSLHGLLNTMRASQDAMVDSFCSGPCKRFIETPLQRAVKRLHCLLRTLCAVQAALMRSLRDCVLHCLLQAPVQTAVQALHALLSARCCLQRAALSTLRNSLLHHLLKAFLQALVKGFD
mmetsp:Transcript_14631/g.36408  ORF Transcript_14631/g.36408 Transcript_14631/m.36408 type:complete len:224 (+) Transcript_14631:442-1113(+)